jgi:hypothetical protein
MIISAMLYSVVMLRIFAALQAAALQSNKIEPAS